MDHEKQYRIFEMIGRVLGILTGVGFVYVLVRTLEVIFKVRLF